MKNTFKKVMGTLMAVALLVGVLAVPTQKAQAASKLTKADFKFTGMYKSDVNEVFTTSYDWRYQLVNTIEESKPKKCIKTKRGIVLTSTKAQVFKKYGKVKLKKLGKNSALYKKYKKNGIKNCFDLFKNEKCATYSYKSGSDTFKLYFFFDKKEKINTIIVTKNC